MNTGRAIYPLFVCIGLAATAAAGELDRYRYVIEESKNEKVCRHMERVYNENFAFPWKHPPLDLGGVSYGPNSPYAFPKLSGVTHDDKMTIEMSYSRLPTSPEFNAIRWREGRFRHIHAGSDRGERPMLVAEIDIDNDGQMDTVIKASFMMNFWPSHRSVAGGEDALLVFRKGEIDLSQPIDLEMLYRGQRDRKKPILISGAYSSRLIRPFVFEGVIYLSTYEQKWEGGEFWGPGTKLEAEHMNVLRYRSGGESLGPGKRNPLQLDRICRYRMNVVKNR